ncbi:MAG: hypothetical protein ACOYO1_01400 [Bacteroidales bacterium]
MWIKYLKNIHQTKELSRAAFILIIGIACLIMYFSNNGAYSDTGLIEIKANLINRKLEVHKRYRGPDIYNYIIQIQNYNNNFIIYDDLIGYFDKSSFETFVNFGDAVFINISRKEQGDFNSGSNIKIYGISSYKSVYLNYRKALEMNNSKAPMYLGILLIISGLIMFFYYKDKLIIEESEIISPIKIKK